ncbi:MAG: tetratricopeptide repeat protein [Bryobacteraceae bacterium]
MRTLLALCAASFLTAATNAEIERGFDHFYNLEFDQSVTLFSRLVKASPESADLHNHLAQAFLYRELLRAGALETELVTGGNAFLRGEKMNPTAEEQRAFDDAIAAALRITARTLATTPDDKEALYAQGVAYGLRANYNFLVRKAWLDSLRDATACRKLHNRVTELDPKMIDARMTQGVHDYVVGSLSWSYRFLGFLVGFRGDKAQGIRTVEEVFRHGDRNRADAGILLATVYRRERRAADAVPVLEWLIARYPRNYLFHFELAQMHSDLGNKDKALAAVAAVERLKAAGTPGYDRLAIEKIIYYRATIQFWYGDLDEALDGFERVAVRARDLDPNTGVTALMRVGQVQDLKGQRPKAISAYRKAIAFAPGSYRAKESEEYLRRPFRRT